MNKEPNLNLDAIEQRVRMVDVPPWLAVPVQYNVLGETITGFEVGHAAKTSSAFCRDFDAAKFIREAIIDIPALIARVRELEAADNEVSRAGVALAERVRELEAALQLIADHNDETTIGNYVVHPVAPKGYGVWFNRVIDTALSSHDTFEAAIRAAKGLAEF